VVGDLSLHAEADDDKLFMHLVFLWREAGTFLKSYRLLTLISVTDKFKYEDIKIILQSNIITMNQVLFYTAISESIRKFGYSRKYGWAEYSKPEPIKPEPEPKTPEPKKTRTLIRVSTDGTRNYYR